MVADTSPTVDPEDAGFFRERLKDISPFIRRESEAGALAGAVTMVARHGKIVRFDTVGKYGVDNDKAMDKDTFLNLFDYGDVVSEILQ